MSDASHRVTSIEQLEAIYGVPQGASVAKEIDHIAPAYRRLIEAAPFVAIATGDEHGYDCSPKGDAPGFVRILDDRTLAIPDRPGNNRIDGFRKGHVPAAVLERKFGEELKLDAMGRIMEKAVEEVLKDIPEKPIAYSTPALEGEPKFDLESDFSFAVTYDTFPTVPVADYQGIEIELPAVAVAAADEERELAEIRERNAIVVDKDENGRDKLGFQFVDGPVTPKPEKLPAVKPKAKRRASPKPRPNKPKGDGGGDGGGKKGSVPKVPLLKA